MRCRGASLVRWTWSRLGRFLDGKEEEEEEEEGGQMILVLEGGWNVVMVACWVWSVV